MVWKYDANPLYLGSMPKRNMTGLVNKMGVVRNNKLRGSIPFIFTLTENRALAFKDGLPLAKPHGPPQVTGVVLWHLYDNGVLRGRIEFC